MDDVGADVVDRLLGRWRLVTGGAVGPVPPEVGATTNLPSGIDVTDDGRRSDQGLAMHFWTAASGNRSGGRVEFEVGGATTVHGVWRASPDGVFLADTAGGAGPRAGETSRPRWWLSDAASVVVEEHQMVLRDDAGELTAHFERLPGPWGITSGHTVEGGRAPRSRGVPSGLVPAGGHHLLDAWEPVHLAHHVTESLPRGVRWQNVEFSADGRWHAFPVVNVGGGRWRAGPLGTLLVIHPFATTSRAVNVWRDLDPWLLPVARAGFDGDELVLLDDDNHELQRLRRLTDPQRLRDRGWRIGFPRPNRTDTP